MEPANSTPRTPYPLERRTFMALVSGRLLAAPLATEAQSTKVARVGILSTGNPRSAAIFQAFEQRLRELGYIEGQNLAIEFRNAEGKTERLSGLAAELVGLNADVIVVATDPATRAVKEASAKIPIVIVSVNYDPVELGYIASLARPGTNITGVLFLHRELTGKRFELFKEMLPTVKRVAVLSDPLGASPFSPILLRPSSSGRWKRPTGRWVSSSS
jgi:putative ABC transport system substrate-binding protein